MEGCKQRQGEKKRVATMRGGGGGQGFLQDPMWNLNHYGTDVDRGGEMEDQLVLVGNVCGLQQEQCVQAPAGTTQCDSHLQLPGTHAHSCSYPISCCPSQGRKQKTKNKACQDAQRTHTKCPGRLPG